MSLKAFHIVFVALATALSLAYAGWAVSVGYLVAAAGALLVTATLVSYGLRTYRKIRSGTL